MKFPKLFRNKRAPWILTAVSVPILLMGIMVGEAVYGQQNQGLEAAKTGNDPMKLQPDDNAWNSAPAQTIKLMAQPMIVPRPKLTLTDQIEVKALHNDKSLAFRISWKDPDKSEAGKLGVFSDAVALEFPVKLDKDQPPSPFMGEVGKPVHIFHWRAQYQHDKELGHLPDMKELYPNMSVDIYPMEFKDKDAPKGTEEERRQFSPAQAAGNPQSFAKDGVDEIFAEGFGSSAVAPKHGSQGMGIWQNGSWSVVISRPLSIPEGTQLTTGGKSYVCFAVWQGGQREVGSRKSVSLAWINLALTP